MTAKDVQRMFDAVDKTREEAEWRDYQRAAKQIDAERVGWFRCLIVMHEQMLEEREADGWEDEDPSATFEMLRECRALLEQLEPMAIHEEMPEVPAAVQDDTEIPF
jgi:hypothetical protein